MRRSKRGNDKSATAGGEGSSSSCRYSVKSDRSGMDEGDMIGRMADVHNNTGMSSFSRHGNGGAEAIPVCTCGSYVGRGSTDDVSIRTKYVAMRLSVRNLGQCVVKSRRSELAGTD